MCGTRGRCMSLESSEEEGDMTASAALGFYSMICVITVNSLSSIIIIIIDCSK